MEWAELVLEYAKALVWPAVVVIAVLTFKDDLRIKIAELTKAETPVGSATFDQRARELEEQAADVAEHQENAEARVDVPDEAGSTDTTPTFPPEKERVSRDQRRRDDLEQIETYHALSSAAAVLNSPPDFDAAVNITPTSPEAAVMLAYSELEKVVRAAWTVDRMAAPRRGLSLPMALRDLAKHGGTAAELEPVARELAHLRNRLAHGEADAKVSAAGALDFIATCETLATPLAHTAMSKLRHPSRSQVIRRWIAWAEQENGASDTEGNSA